MSTPRTHFLNWDEFRWEQEIRRDERRINCYFRTLPSCLDLPGEEEMVSGTLAEQPDLVSRVTNTSGMNSAWSYLSPEPENPDEEEGNSGTPPSRRSGENIVESFDKLASEWNLHCALLPELQFAALSIACAYAKLLARTADFFDTPDSQPALKRCLGKRAVNDLLEVSALLDMLGQSAPGQREFIEFQQARLMGLREQLADYLAGCR